ncbi:MAG TPA: DNA polymerase III subunit gamma/tau [Bryobacteraceae bacterium]|nr:DNA polymerase III subunit gamma/tau [Bryobacteraceae bacterium]
MSYQVIARKYRPAKFSELIGQEHVRTTLENAITQKRIAHGYILSGQRGTGKTTVARIIARCLNCIDGPTPTPCGVCASCTEVAAGNSVDVIEIDAASNRGINEMRELRDNIRYRPARDRYKVFIVDEAHQITNEAFNALLKTLEEPPEWVVFILCTTEVHKIPVTIASRCQQFSFRSVDFAELVARMRWICEQEGITTDDEVLAVLAQSGEGSVRDSLSALDQAIACCGSTLKASELRGLLGLFSLEALQQVTGCLRSGDSARMLEVVQELERNGQNLQHFCRELARYFRNLLVAKIAGKETRLISSSPVEQERLREIASGFSEEDLTRYLQLTLDLFQDLQSSLQPRLHVEIGLLKLVHVGRLVSIEQALAGMQAPSASPPRSVPPASAASSPAARPRTGPSPFTADTQRKAAAPESAPPPTPTPSLASGDWRTRVHKALLDLGMLFTADAVEHSDVSEQNGELTFVTSKDWKLAMTETDLRKAAQEAAGKPMRVKVVIGEAAPATAAGTPLAKPAVGEDEVSQRALSHPDVQRFKEVFPNAEIRQVRNLKE